MFMRKFEICFKNNCIILLAKTIAIQSPYLVMICLSLFIFEFTWEYYPVTISDLGCITMGGAGVQSSNGC